LHPWHFWRRTTDGSWLFVAVDKLKRKLLIFWKVTFNELHRFSIDIVLIFSTSACVHSVLTLCSSSLLNHAWVLILQRIRRVEIILAQSLWDFYVLISLSVYLLALIGPNLWCKIAKILDAFRFLVKTHLLRALEYVAARSDSVAFLRRGSSTEGGSRVVGGEGTGLPVVIGASDPQVVESWAARHLKLYPWDWLSSRRPARLGEQLWALVRESLCWHAWLLAVEWLKGKRLFCVATADGARPTRPGLVLLADCSGPARASVAAMAGAQHERKSTRELPGACTLASRCPAAGLTHRVPAGEPERSYSWGLRQCNLHLANAVVEALACLHLFLDLTLGPLRLELGTLLSSLSLNRQWWHPIHLQRATPCLVHPISPLTALFRKACALAHLLHDNSRAVTVWHSYKACLCGTTNLYSFLRVIKSWLNRKQSTHTFGKFTEGGAPLLLLVVRDLHADRTLLSFHNFYLSI